MTPARPDSPPLARATYADAGRTNAFQLAVAASSLATVVARRAGGVVAAGVAACALALAVALFARSRRRLGRVTIVAEGGALRFGDAVTLRARDVTLWTLAGGRARLYTRDGGWTIWPVEPSTATAAALERCLGPATPLVRRGSNRAIATAAAVALGGVALFVFAVAAESAWAVVPATLSVILGLATALALAQRVKR